MKDSPGCQKIIIIIFFQNYTIRLLYVPGPELEYVCQNNDTLYYIYVLLSFAAKSPGLLEALCSQVVGPIASQQGTGTVSH